MSEGERNRECSDIFYESWGEQGESGMKEWGDRMFVRVWLGFIWYIFEIIGSLSKL